jgi:hypothetical protein
VKKPGIIFLFLLFAFVSKAQPGEGTLKPPAVTIDFGSGFIDDLNTADLYNYRRVAGFCPTDGHYSFASFTMGCFRDDWHTLSLDHTPGDNEGNMLLVNAAPDGGVFLSVPVNGLKTNTTYQLSLWVINLCRPTKKCPFLLLPSLSIRLVTPDGKVVANIVTRDLPRVEEPNWAKHMVYLTTPASTANLRLVMADNAPGGCGNDFALDDIVFREFVKKTVQPVATQKAKPKPVASNPVAKKTAAPAPKKTTTPPPQKTPVAQQLKPKPDTVAKTIAVVKQPEKIVAPTPLILKTRTNELYKKIDSEAGEIRISLYDNGEIDGDTVSIYHNNKLVRSHVRLTQEAIPLTIAIDESQPHHELVMVAENLGSIPPNTSVMVINTPRNRYEVFISSNTQKNAKVVFDLKK